MRRAALFLLALFTLPAIAWPAPFFSYRGVVPCRDGIEALARVLGPHDRRWGHGSFEVFEWNRAPESDYGSIAATVVGLPVVAIELRLRRPMREAEARERFGPPSETLISRVGSEYEYYPGGREPAKDEVLMRISFEGGEASAIEITCSPL